MSQTNTTLDAVLTIEALTLALGAMDELTDRHPYRWSEPLNVARATLLAERVDVATNALSRLITCLQVSYDYPRFTDTYTLSLPAPHRDYNGERGALMERDYPHLYALAAAMHAGPEAVGRWFRGART